MPKNIEDSNLSVPVSLDLDGVSTWQAIKSVMRQVHCNWRFGEIMGLNLITLSAFDVPDNFDAPSQISLHVKNVPARDALCMIMAQSPVSVGIESANVYRPDLLEDPSMVATRFWEVRITFYQGNQPVVADQHMSGEESRKWGKEVEEAKLPAENCGEEKE